MRDVYLHPCLMSFIRDCRSGEAICKLWHPSLASGIRHLSIDIEYISLFTFNLNSYNTYYLITLLTKYYTPLLVQYYLEQETMTT